MKKEEEIEFLEKHLLDLDRQIREARMYLTRLKYEKEACEKRLKELRGES